MNDLLSKLEEIKLRFDDVATQIVDPEVINDMSRYVKLNKDYKELEEVVKTYHIYKNVIENIASSKQVLQEEKDEEFREMAKMELDELTVKREKLEEEIKVMLLPKDPEDAKNAVVEIRAGTGGDEASIFVGDLFRMYTKFCEGKGWKTEVVDSTEGTAGGFKEIIFNVNGADVYGTMKYESGVHRVQRIPQTETQGRVHTSASTVAVLPEAEEFDIELKDSDIRKDTYCASGPGGQSVNTTYSAVRLTHVPTGIVAQCQDQKSQIKNYEKALKVLRSRIYEIELQKHLEEIAGKRKTMVSTGDRSAKIRTYNYPQGRVTDHRIGLTLYNLSNIMDGELEEISEALQMAENAEKMKAGEVL
jgi:peptide chain release factor 1